ncbi:alpha-tubulin N-acetyltransferase 1 [Drosophila tropicalis]|uniref:alpha-tubulin N-acetyltransferase 1 n=1 Tax=Drosophila tropicalis TaxID=46794 RepID=UPI0035AB7438
MVDFNFDIRPFFPQPIIRVHMDQVAAPGNRMRVSPRSDAAIKLSIIIDRMGHLSALAQGLSRPVTSADRLSSNQTIYLLADTQPKGGRGVVIGLLKVGTKNLYLFDERGERRKQDQTPAILDFYVHESRQRHGLGKRLFENMLAEKRWTPLKCSVDRPSEKLLTFLKKHYGLVRTIPQANNFVLYEGFFGDAGNSTNNQSTRSCPMQSLPALASPSVGMLMGGASSHTFFNTGSPYHNNQTQITTFGRYGAPRPITSMGEIMRSGNQ